MVGRRLPTTIKPSHYALRITPTPAERDQLGFERFEAEVFIRLEVNEDTNRFVLHAKELRIGRCTFTAEGDHQQYGLIGHIKEKTQLEIVFPNVIKTGTHGTLRIIYNGNVTTNGVGIYQNSYKEGKLRGLATQCEPMDCCAIMPCWDEPEFKATFELEVTVPSFYTVLFNTEELSSSEPVPGFTTHVFDRTPLMSTYLLALFIGEAEALEAKSKNNVRVRVWVPVGRCDVGEFQLNTAVRVLNFFEEFYSYAYSMPKLDLIGLDSFVFGGMENWGLITFKSSAFYFNPLTCSIRSHFSGIYNIAHEIAHMWFGNLVTMRWWNELWLNEGFATYAGWLAVRHCFPDLKVDTIILQREIVPVLALDSTKSTHVVVIDESIDDPLVVSNMFDDITYGKGFLVLLMTASLCGDDFMTGVRSYIQKHAYGNAVTEDFLIELDAASGKDVGTLVRKWTSIEGYPLVCVKQVKNELIVSQERFLSNGERLPLEEPWPIPLRASWGKESVNFLFDTERATFKLPNSALDSPYLILNHGQAAPMQVLYSADMWSGLTRNTVELAQVDRLGTLNSSILLARAGLIHTIEVLRLSESLIQSETCAQGFLAIFDLLSSFYRVWEHDTGEPKISALLGKFQEKIMGKTLFFVGETAGLDETQETEELRSKCLEFLIESNNQSYTTACIHSESTATNWTALSAARLSVALTSELAKLPANRAEYIKRVWREGDPEVRKIWLDCYASSPHILLSEKITLAYELNSSEFIRFVCKIRDKGGVWIFLKSNWDTVMHKMGQQAFPCTRILTATLKDFSDLSMISDVDAWFKSLSRETRELIDSSVYRLRAEIQQNHSWVHRDKLGVRDFLQDVMHHTFA